MSDLSDRIQETIDAEPVVAFIKGTHEQCMCGNSERALQALRSVGTSFIAVDVLPDPAIRQELSALSSWLPRRASGSAVASSTPRSGLRESSSGRLPSGRAATSRRW